MNLVLIRSEIVSTIEKVFQILEELGKKPLSFSEIQKGLSLAKSTAWSLITQMEAAGSIEKDPTGRYHLAPFMLRLGLSVLHQLSIRELAEPLMRGMAEETKEIIHLCILDRKTLNIVYIAKVEGPSSIHIKTFIGSSNPCYCTAAGKVLISQLTNQEIHEYLDHLHPVGFTEQTIMDRDSLWTEFQSVREAGYAMDRGEHIEYSVGISAPVFDHQGCCVAALSVTGLSERMKEKEEPWTQLVKDKAQVLSHLMGYIPNLRKG
jgi:IclR family transcriptional regulator, KDG regulon repressor